MKKIITINYLSHTRTNYSKLTFYFLNKIKEENKSKVQLNILSTIDDNWVEKLKPINGIDIKVYTIKGGNNYLPKLNIALSSNTKYSVKLDEDCFINNHIWDYIIENVNQLDNEENLLIAPIMTNNIPSCDLFIDLAIKDKNLRENIFNNFLNQPMPNGLWGVNYEPLNKYTINAEKWSYSDFYDGVEKLNTQTKGIHPIRICGKSQVMINDYISKNIDIIINEKEYGILEFEAPYFTNSLFVIKTDEWKKIVNSKVDDYDEISLNNYKKKYNKKILFIKNAFGLHLMYNTVYGNKNKWGIGLPNGDVLEKEFYKNIEKQIIV